MQAVLSRRDSRTDALHSNSIILPQPKFRKIMDFLEDRWGTNIVKRKNEFYRANRQDRPIARLSSEDSLMVAVVDQTTERWHEIKTRIDDIELPKPIVVEQRIYRNLLYQLVRASGGGVIRWINKFYGTEAGKVIAELVSNDTIRIFETDGLFGTSRIIAIDDYAAINVPRQEYFHLLDFLVQQSGGDVRRIGNEFYPKNEGEFLDSIPKSPWTVSKGITSYLNTRILARLVSSSAVRFPDGTTKKISQLVLTKRVCRNHLYFCGACQSFVRAQYRSNTHRSESGVHVMTYLSSTIALLPNSQTKTAAKAKNRLPEIVYRFWGIERGKVPVEKRVGRATKRSQLIESFPILGHTKLAQPRVGPTTLLLQSADITVDRHRLTNEERLLALQRLDGIENPSPETDYQSVENAKHVECGGKNNPPINSVSQRRPSEKEELPELLVET